MEAALRARLLGAAPVAALLPDYTPPGEGPRKTVFNEERPQSSPLPALLISIISDIRAQTLSGWDMLEARAQVDVLATSFAQKKALKEAVITALAPAQEINGIQFMRATDIAAVPRNERTETQFIFRDAIDFLIRWKVTA
jgi:hypothetical protein